jgi:SAM-dependent methyltransferase
MAAATHLVTIGSITPDLTLPRRPCYTACLDRHSGRMRTMHATLPVSDLFFLSDGIYLPHEPVDHREEEYPSHALASLGQMQARHFWYRGRHRFLLHALHRQISADGSAPARSLIDLGAGCGGWVDYLLRKARFPIAEAALADSSLAALRWARRAVPENVACFQADLLHLPWENRWDMAFLLDVLEHLPRHEQALQQVRRTLRPGGMLFVTAPALPLFWSWHDEAAGHQRRYTRWDFKRLSAECGYELLEARYFMFFLSPLYLASRLWVGQGGANGPPEKVAQRLARTLRIPPRPLNKLLGGVFHCETPLGHLLPFPCGTSILGVFRKPLSAPACPVKQAHAVAVRIAHDHVPIAFRA